MSQATYLLEISLLVTSSCMKVNAGIIFGDDGMTLGVNSEGELWASTLI